MGKRSSVQNGVVDCELGKRGVWLVKVPRYLSEQWEKQQGSDVGRLEIAPRVPGRGASGEVIFRSTDHGDFASGAQSSSSAASSSSAMNGMNPVPLGKRPSESTQTPKEHRFVIGDIKNQTMAVISEDKTSLGADAEIKSGRLCLEGRVVKRAECRPPASLGYLKMKISQIEKSGQPKRQIQQIDKAEVKFKPVAIHAEDMAREKAKKEGIKAVRADKDKVVSMLFQAFEKHQYYRLIDLQKLTNQPPGYIKEILNEIATYNTAPPHKSMWELKSEYRHYKNE
uniref:General transcription factor IIF subunit 2 n=1 Tax=Plectus sambesii TaxID=2011161 RepID=A0A914WIH6_9BILA